MKKHQALLDIAAIIALVLLMHYFHVNGGQTISPFDGWKALTGGTP